MFCHFKFVKWVTYSGNLMSIIADILFSVSVFWKQKICLEWSYLSDWRVYFLTQSIAKTGQLLPCGIEIKEEKRKTVYLRDIHSHVTQGFALGHAKVSVVGRGGYVPGTQSAFLKYILYSSTFLTWNLSVGLAVQAWKSSNYVSTFQSAKESQICSRKIQNK